jgi:hypothetical protein
MLCLMMEAGLLAELPVDDVKTAIAEVFPRWRVAHDDAGWHAVRKGRFRADRLNPEAAVHAVHHRDPLMLVLQLHHQDQIPPPDGWVVDEEPIELARDEIARQIEREYPGARVSHDMFGWSARFEGRDRIRAQSPNGLRALMPFISG